jgi:hypothetical protein
MKWISQTNQDRRDLFLKDNTMVLASQMHILPNYPPANWAKNSNRDLALPLKIIYVGALNLRTMYAKEFADWVIGQNGKVKWDIYSGNIDEETSAYFQSLQTELITFKGSVNYFHLPGIFAAYDLGVILYKGHIPNYIYNIPNKLFEYYGCGLDVWFPLNMKSSLALVTENTFPKIVDIDFEHLENINIEKLVNRSGFEYKPSVYYSEPVFCELMKELGY